MLLMPWSPRHALHLLCVVLLMHTTTGWALDPDANYEVEMIVFQNKTLTGSDGEQFGKELRTSGLAEARPLLDAKSPNLDAGQPFVRLAGTELRLGNVIRKLRKNKSYAPLIHLGWRQPILPLNSGNAALIYHYQTPPLTFLPPGAIKPKLSNDKSQAFGTLQLSQGKQPRVAVNITLNNPVGNSPQTYQLQESRRIKLGELYYFDHPLFGVIVQVRPARKEATVVPALPAPAPPGSR